MSPTSGRERIVANFVQPADPQRNYVHWRNFLRQWWILGGGFNFQVHDL